MSEENARKIYLITDGEYSDYRIYGVYSTLEKAEQARRLFAIQNAVEEWDLDNIPDHPQDCIRFCVGMERDK